MVGGVGGYGWHNDITKVCNNGLEWERFDIYKGAKVIVWPVEDCITVHKNIVKYTEAYWLSTNTYAPWVANEITNGKQMNVTWYEDELKVSHEEPVHITKFVCYLSSLYGKELKVNRGKFHHYLGMYFLLKRDM